MTDSPLQVLLEFDARSQRDHDQPAAFLHRRDRKFALSCEQQGQTPDARLWLDHMARLSGPGSQPSVAETTRRLWRRINTGFTIAGVLLGVLTMLGLLFYDGGQRINITVFLAFVLLQLLLALFTTVQSMAGWQPWRWLVRRVTPRGSTGVANRLNPVLMARAAHLGGLGFALSGLLTLLVMVVVQDLAFGWSTTLETSAPGYHQLVLALAAPWSWLWPAAVPDLALVEATRFFRAGSGASTIDPQRWGQWWRFVTMLWLTWVLLPRCLLTLVSMALLRRRARQLLAGHPGMHALMYRMETPTLDTGSQHNDAQDMPDTGTRTTVQPLPDSNILLCWAGAGEPELPDTLTGEATRKLRAGGRASLAEDRAALVQIADWLEQEDPARAVIVVTRSWEPPTGELQDFLNAARQSWPSGTRVALVPLSLDTRREPEAHQLRQWLRFADRVGEDFVGVSAPRLEWRDPFTEQGDLA
ncbi:DUF2868 domain-containing protein [Marinobacter sp. F4206]|uniref:DUF2868 domain-containing protein n=1 Tax=Marinobacter sp. F4206 TaxID=2861777 RepID=UPI001C5D5058|nr:DUF2868 domain-containing protein [Marinobacter sp. F4206]MBW4935109.1 DUF2868 domain-containing protein [Marinobacter sp. F4206]